MKRFRRFRSHISAGTCGRLLGGAGIVCAIMLALPATAQDEPAGNANPAALSAELSEECAAFQRDPDADIGEILRANCKPSLAQMSALMDNPLGNVAMLFTQFDFYVKKEPISGREDTQVNYMGIAQFPKRLNKNWNLINRVIWNVGSVPLDLDQDSGYGSVPPGDITPPPEDLPPGVTPPLPIDVFRGRTTGGPATGRRGCIGGNRNLRRHQSTRGGTKAEDVFHRITDSRLEFHNIVQFSTLFSNLMIRFSESGSIFHGVRPTESIFRRRNSFSWQTAS